MEWHTFLSNRLGKSVPELPEISADMDPRVALTALFREMNMLTSSSGQPKIPELFQRSRDLPGTHLESAAQECFFFKLLKSFLSTRHIVLDRNRFIRRDVDGTRYLCTEALPEYLNKWKNANHSIRMKTAVTELGQTVDRLTEMSEYVRKLRDTIQWTVTDQEPTPIEAIYISIVILRESIYHTIIAHDRPDGNAPLWIKKKDFALQSTTMLFDQNYASEIYDSTIPFLKARLNKNNWCPYRVQPVVRNASMLYWLSAARPYSVDDSRKVEKDHKDCTATSCRHANVKSGEYEPQHCCQPGEKCQLVGPRKEELERLVSTDKIPVISVDLDSLRGTQPTIELIDSESAPNYIAISHVWADGLGNPNKNEHYTCQMARIMRHCVAVSKSPNIYSALDGREKDESKNNFKQEDRVYFWLDTLCIPTSANPELKTKAISKMSIIYQNARKVLVIDASLQQHEYSEHEKLARLSVTPWLRRLWTLQEAFLPGLSVYFQFNEKAVSLPSIWLGKDDSHIAEFWDPSKGFQDRSKSIRNGESLYPTFCHSTPLQLLYFLVDPWHIAEVIPAPPLKGKFRQQVRSLVPKLVSRLMHTPPEKLSPEERRRIVLRSLVEPLSRRTTSHQEDEAFCLATLLNLCVKDIEKIYNRKGVEARMSLFWDKISESIDPQCLFTPGPRLKTKGFKWAPSSLIGTTIGSNAFAYTDLQEARRCKRGLLLKTAYWDVIREEIPEGENRQGWWLMKNEKDWYLVANHSNPEAVELDQISPNEEKMKEWFASLEEIPKIEKGSPTIIWLDPANAYQKGFKVALGVLVAIDYDQMKERVQKGSDWVDDTKGQGTWALPASYVCRVRALHLGTSSPGLTDAEEYTDADATKAFHMFARGDIVCAEALASKEFCID
ncbi:hypothetical protein PVAG01_08113 [Phlyctema vagabunda]|uniref:Heterokaryon incompatibility domain-containing protein n=1 Tax=Phlyctema vagabunda TaxID=108571 RepID=A0ABR4P8H4_9HELO